MRVVVIEVPELGNRTYLVHDGKVGVVIDPSRRIQSVLDKAKQSNVEIRAVFETHIHNDYITGGLMLAGQLAVPYYVSAEDHVDFHRQKISIDQEVNIGKLQITALSSPGHTSHHLSYLIEQDDEIPALFSGGSLLYGTVGRPDLESKEATLRLAKSQYRTAQFFVDRLDEHTILYPTHGFGSFCAATGTEHVKVSTIKEQLKRNTAYTATNEDIFAKQLIKNLEVHPSYYAFMAPANLKGPLSPSLDKPKLLTKEKLMSAIHSGAGVIDMRSRTAYAARHISGTYNIEKNKDFATYVGWLIEWGAPIILVAASEKEVNYAQEQLSLIGREILAGQMRSSDLFKNNNDSSRYSVHSFDDLKKLLSDENILVMDVRRKSEWHKAHIIGAINVPLHELTDKLGEITSEKEIWVHCASGFRASIAASILSGHGKKTVLINDNFYNALRLGLVEIKKQKFVNDVIRKKAQLLDVRDTKEWKEAHAIGAIHIPLGKLLDGYTSPLQEDVPIYVYCETGDRSGTAEYFLNENDFQAVNIGGLDNWEQAGGLVES